MEIRSDNIKVNKRLLDYSTFPGELKESNAAINTEMLNTKRRNYFPLAFVLT